VPEPGNPQAFNRYAYTLNNPVRYTDPSGHCIQGWNCPGDGGDGDNGGNNGGGGGGNGSGGALPGSGNPPRSGLQKPPRNVSSVYWALGKSRKWWEGPHCSQHDNFSCGPASVAMMLNALTSSRWEQEDIRVPLTRLLFLGATKPEWLAEAFNKNAANEGISYRSEVHRDASKDKLIHEIKQGNPVTTLVMFGPVRGHYINVVGYDTKNDIVYYLNPQSTKPEVEEMNWQDFDTGISYKDGNWAWSQETIWLDSHNRIMIVYHP